MGNPTPVRVHPVLAAGALMLAAALAAAEPKRDQRIAGRVLDDAGKPVPKYVVRAAPPAGVTYAGSYTPNTMTDADGRFVLRNLAPGIHRLWSGEAHILIAKTGTHANMDPLPVRAGTTDVTIRVLRYRTIEGVVRDPAGKPLAGCAVQVRRKPPRPHQHVASMTRGREYVARGTKTDAEGRFRIERYPSVQPVELSVAVPHDRIRELVPIVRDGVVPGEGPLELVAGVTLAVAGVVRDEEGKPVVRAVVKTNRYRRVVTDAAGRFELRPLSPGATVNLTIEGPPRPDGAWFPVVLEAVKAGRSDLEVVLRGAHVVTGEIVGVPPAALRGVTLSARGAFRRTIKHEFDGSSTAFRLAPLPADLVELSVDLRKHPGLTAPKLRLPIDAPAKDVKIELATAYVLRGKLTGPTGLGRVRISYYDAWGRHREPSRYTRVGESFEIPRVPAGAGALYTSDRGKHMALLRDVDPTKGPFLLELAEGTTIRGRIVGLPGEVKIGSVKARAGRFRYTKRLERDGTFETPPLPPGRWNLEFDVGDPVGGIVPTLKNVKAGAQGVVARWDPDK